jgi:hypothetical protein
MRGISSSIASLVQTFREFLKGRNEQQLAGVTQRWGIRLAGAAGSRRSSRSIPRIASGVSSSREKSNGGSKIQVCPESVAGFKRSTQHYGPFN